MQKITSLLAVIIFFSFLSLSAQEIFFEEDFENGIPADWVAEDGWLHGTSIDLSSQSFNIPEHGQFMCVNDDVLGTVGTSLCKLITPAIPVVEGEGLLFSFEYFYLDLAYQGIQEEGKLFMSTDSLMTWQEIGYLTASSSQGWTTYSKVIAQTLLADIDSVYFAFEFNDNGGWLYGLCVDDVVVSSIFDYAASASAYRVSSYTMTPISQQAAFDFSSSTSNNGNESLEGFTINYELSKDGITVEEQNNILDILSGETIIDTVSFSPNSTGEYTLEMSFLHNELSIDTQMDSFNITDSIMATDDGVPEIEWGFSFSDPSLLGYLGNAFTLNTLDTVTSISVFIGADMDPEATINFTIVGFDEAGEVLEEEIFHSENISVPQEYFGGFYTYQLPEPIELFVGTYIFGVGQDEIQGVYTVGFDASPNGDDYWAISPNQNGGYPWSYLEGQPFVLMIRPNFGIVEAPSFINSPLSNIPLAQVFPNPVENLLQVEFGEIGDYDLEISDLSGKILKRFSSHNSLTFSTILEYLPAGAYYLTVKNLDRVWTSKLLKK